MERSKLYAITVNNENKLRQLTSDALLSAAKGMKMQLELLNRKKEEKKNPLDEILEMIGTVIDNQSRDIAEAVADRLS